MPFVSIRPQGLTAAASTSRGIGPSTSAQMYQAVGAHAAAIHEMFVGTSAGSYAATDAANPIAAG
ncbi:PE domain-containing protein [Mycobacterium sp.]|uniref:PE domain-containing protein n=1 Tax=Mycobacterium sp. TaxID=1785 RepID=UPI002BF03B06|nr:PE domain-containing protein [Mycobacterium sp.]HTQ18262.1 PE domain-containing protein [Mycobacterium sp.]